MNHTNVRDIKFTLAVLEHNGEYISIMFNKVHFNSFRYELGQISVVLLILRRQDDTCDSCALGLNTNNTIALKHLVIITEQRLLLADNILATAPNNCIDLHQSSHSWGPFIIN